MANKVPTRRDHKSRLFIKLFEDKLSDSFPDRKNGEYALECRAVVDQAVDFCIGEGVLADFLKRHRTEVTEMILTEYNEGPELSGGSRAGDEAGDRQT